MKWTIVDAFANTGYVLCQDHTCFDGILMSDNDI